MSDHSQAGPPADRAAGEPQHLSRRSMLRGAGASAAGLAAIAVAGPAVPALAAASRPAPARGSSRTDGRSGGTSEPVVVHLRDARSGEIDVFAGTSHTRLRDPDLAARLARAAR
jgi:hypothetical protein